MGTNVGTKNSRSNKIRLDKYGIKTGQNYVLNGVLLSLRSGAEVNTSAQGTTG